MSDRVTRARAALANPLLAPIMAAIPAAHRQNPHEMLGWFRAARQINGLDASFRTQ
jgi:hypothetical protein